MVSSKRKLLEIIDDFYDYLRKYDLIHLSDIRENVVSSPSDRHILDLIINIQKRPYIYVKSIGRETILKLSTHNRDPKVRYPQANDVIEFVKGQQERLIHRIDEANTHQYKLIIEDYRKLVDDITDQLVKLRDNEEIRVIEDMDISESEKEGKLN
jgi:hypothetical protein